MTVDEIMDLIMVHTGATAENAQAAAEELHWRLRNEGVK